jgi:hypothetical protein
MTIEDDESEQPTNGYFSDLKKSFKKSLRTVKFFFELAALAVVIFYASETRRTNNLTQKALDTNAAQFRIQQRPYISAAPRSAYSVHVPKPIGKAREQIPPGLENGGDVAMFKVPYGDGYRITIAVDIRNSGKSPAVNVLTTPSHIIFGLAADAREAVRKYVPDYADQTSTTMMVDQTLTVGTEEPVISSRDDKLIADQTGELYIIGGVRYQDLSLPSIPPYETIYCFRLNTTGLPFAGCPTRETAFH